MFRFFCCGAKSEFKQNTIVPEVQLDPELFFIDPVSKIDPVYEFCYYPFLAANLLKDDITLDELASALMTVFEGYFVGNKYIKASLEGSIQSEILCRSFEEATEKYEPINPFVTYIKFQLPAERLKQEKISLTLKDIHSIVDGNDRSFKVINEADELQIFSGSDLQNWLTQNIRTPYSPK